jgi:hypothetical protein
MINPAISNMPKAFCQMSELVKITFGGGYRVMKQRFTYQQRKIPKNTWKEIEYLLDIVHFMKDPYIDV